MFIKVGLIITFLGVRGRAQLHILFIVSVLCAFDTKVTSFLDGLVVRDLVLIGQRLLFMEWMLYARIKCSITILSMW